MKSHPAIALPLPKAAIGFRPEYLDFRRGIRVGNLEDHERITRILKLGLEANYQTGFVTERWGRGVFWQWIAFLSRSNREAKPQSSHVSFGCSKFFISVDTEEKLFKCGLQIERGYEKAPRSFRDCQLRPDWDWHRLLQGLRPRSALARQLRRLILEEGFSLHAGGWAADNSQFSKVNFPSMGKLRHALEAAPKNHWAGFQLFYSMNEAAVQGSTGLDLVESMLAVFREVTPLMNLTMQIELQDRCE